MRFDPLMFDEVQANCWRDGPGGRLILHASQPVGLMVRRAGYDVPVGFGVRFDLRISDPYSFKVLSKDKDVLAFVRTFGQMAVESSGLILTNANPGMMEEGSSLYEVRKLFREQQLRERERDMKFREQTAALRAERLALENSRKAASEAAKPPAEAPAEPVGGADGSA